MAASTNGTKLTASPSFGANQRQNKHKPNVLLVLTDDIGIDQVPLYDFNSHSVPPTPNLAALQSVGLTFRNVWTMPACSTAATMLTSPDCARTGTATWASRRRPSLPRARWSTTSTAEAS